jgi:hypothetical protein
MRFKSFFFIAFCCLFCVNCESKDEQLLHAVKELNYEKTQHLLEKGANPYFVHYGKTIIQITQEFYDACQTYADSLGKSGKEDELRVAIRFCKTQERILELLLSYPNNRR